MASVCSRWQTVHEARIACAVGGTIYAESASPPALDESIGDAMSQWNAVFKQAFSFPAFTWTLKANGGDALADALIDEALLVVKSVQYGVGRCWLPGRKRRP